MPDPTPAELLQEMFPPVRLVINGTAWVEVDADQTTIERDIYIMTKARTAHLDGFRADADFDSHLQVEGVLREILGRILESGMFFDLLAGLLVAEGTPWTKAGTQRAMEIFRAVTDKETKDKMLNACAKLVLGFFIGAVSASMPTPKSSGEAPVLTAPVRVEELLPAGIGEAA